MGNDLLACLIDCDAVSVQCYFLPPKGRRKYNINIGKITFRRHNLPHEVYIGVESCPTLTDHIGLFSLRVRNGVLAIQPSTIASQPDALMWLTLSFITQSYLRDNTHTNSGGSYGVSYKSCPTFKFESETVVQLGLTLHEAKQELRRCVFSFFLVT